MILITFMKRVIFSQRKFEIISSQKIFFQQYIFEFTLSFNYHNKNRLSYDKIKFI